MGYSWRPGVPSSCAALLWEADMRVRVQDQRGFEVAAPTPNSTFSQARAGHCYPGAAPRTRSASVATLLSISAAQLASEGPSPREWRGLRGRSVCPALGHGVEHERGQRHSVRPERSGGLEKEPRAERHHCSVSISLPHPKGGKRNTRCQQRTGDEVIMRFARRTSPKQKWPLLCVLGCPAKPATQPLDRHSPWPRQHTPHASQPMARARRIQLRGEAHGLFAAGIRPGPARRRGQAPSPTRPDDLATRGACFRGDGMTSAERRPRGLTLR